MSIPQFLYHATYEPLMESIYKKGLKGGERKNWDNSNPDTVCLASSIGEAESYAELGRVPDEWVDNGIVILKIDCNDLNIKLLFLDSNIILEPKQEITSFEYYGVVNFFEVL